jgi:hypothetical protein
MSVYARLRGVDVRTLGQEADYYFGRKLTVEDYSDVLPSFEAGPLKSKPDYLKLSTEAAIGAAAISFFVSLSYGFCEAVNGSLNVLGHFF